jgi:anti-sigma B factor antagonist
MGLYASTRTIGDAMVVDCAGRIVFGEESSRLREIVYPLIHDYKQITINFANVSYVDSGGLGTLVGLYTSARNRGSKINLAGLNHRVMNLLNLTKLATVFEIFSSVDDAVRAHQGADAYAGRGGD